MTMQDLRHQFWAFIESDNPHAKLVRDFSEVARAKGWKYVITDELARSIYHQGAGASPATTTFIVEGVTRKDLLAVYPSRTEMKIGAVGAQVYPTAEARPFPVELWAVQDTLGLRQEDPQEVFTITDVTRAVSLDYDQLFIDPLNSITFGPGFYRVLRSHVIELHTPKHFTPEVTITRALGFAAAQGFEFGPKMKAFIEEHRGSLSVRDIVRTQYTWMGSRTASCYDIQRLIGLKGNCQDRNCIVCTPLVTAGV